ncbi:hypothetical protein VDGL01_12694 [Verticillium dahliae]
MLSSRHPEEQAGVDCYRASCIHDSHTRRHHRYPLLPMSVRHLCRTIFH